MEYLDPDTDFPELIAQLRTNVGLSQAAASERGNIHASQWSRVERGQSTQLTLNVALAMLRGVGMKIGLVLDSAQES